MSYDKPDRRVYIFTPHTFTGSEVYGLRGPKGKAGRLIDWGVMGVTTAFAGGTNGKVSVGLSGTLEAYGKYLTITGADSTGESVRSRYDPIADAASYAALVGSVGLDIPADTAVQVSALSASGGGEAGVGQPFCVIDWAD
jgi:hypothetical protein